MDARAQEADLGLTGPADPNLPSLILVGDSTVRNGHGKGSDGLWGWGAPIADLFDPAKINVVNRAIGGLSSHTYISQGHWANTLELIKPGDFVLIQFGHNDGGDLGGAKPRGSLHGIGEETQDVPQTTGPFAGKTETVYTFGFYLRKYIADARAKGATPILLTLTVRNIWTTGPDGKPHIERDMGYNDSIWRVGVQKSVPVLDIGRIEADHLEALGPQKTAALFPKDHTHTSPEGAALAAQSVAEALRASQLPLSTYLKP